MNSPIIRRASWTVSKSWSYERSSKDVSVPLAGLSGELDTRADQDRRVRQKGRLQPLYGRNTMVGYG